LEHVYAEPSAGDGRGADRKSQQLCKQVERTLASVLPECREPVLRALVVAEVRPLLGASRLEVVLLAPEIGERDRRCVEARLARARAFLRAEVAQQIHRKRVPELSFVVLAGGAP